MAMWGLDILTAGSLMLLSGGGSDVVCTVRHAPQVSVTPQTQEISYDYDQTSAALSAMKSDTVSPYAPDADVTTGGLRADRPETRIEVRWNILEYPVLGLVCLSYDRVDITTTLKPKIYIAKDFTTDRRCKAAILEHEKKHVLVDRQIINKYAPKIGQAVKDTIDEAGALGPYKKDELDHWQKQMIEHVEAAAARHRLQMEKEMRARQAEVDSLEEYNRVSKICRR